jgi:hypothetical protein
VAIIESHEMEEVGAVAIMESHEMEEVEGSQLSLDLSIEENI